jgi:hypothetical protein
MDLFGRREAKEALESAKPVYDSVGRLYEELAGRPRRN